MTKATLYKKYPLRSVVVYNGSTVLHFLLGSVIISLSGSFLGGSGFIFAAAYCAGALIQMYLFMPALVCRNCVYFRLDGSRCVSGLNILAKRFLKEGTTTDFPKRAQGVLCPNNLYIGCLVFPLLCGAPIMVFHFSIAALVLETGLFLLLIARFFYIIPKHACVHCLSKFICPQAGQMGVREK